MIKHKKCDAKYHKTTCRITTKDFDSTAVHIIGTYKQNTHKYYETHSLNELTN